MLNILHIYCNLNTKTRTYGKNYLKKNLKILIDRNNKKE